MRKSIQNSCLVLSLLVLSGCTGLDSSSTFSCSKDHPVNCQSVSDAYRVSQTESPLTSVKESESLETQGLNQSANSDTSITSTERTNGMGVKPTGKQPINASTPKRLPEITAQLTLAPWTDAQGNLHGTENIFILVRPARWATQQFREKERTHTVTPLMKDLKQ